MAEIGYKINCLYLDIVSLSGCSPFSLCLGLPTDQRGVGVTLTDRAEIVGTYLKFQNVGWRSVTAMLMLNCDWDNWLTGWGAE